METQQGARLILMRHGESAWNKLNVFTGWVDIPLSTRGIEQAREGGAKIRALPVDIVYTSTLMRAQMTAMLALADHSQGRVPVVHHPRQGNLESWGQIYNEATLAATLPVISAWELNERMYGELQGCNKDETRARFGDEQVKIWRRSYDIPPPNGESLAMTAGRTIPYFREQIVPQLQQGKNVFIVAHGNSLRSIIMDLDGLSKEQVLELEIPLGEPILYRYNEGSFSKLAL